MSLLTPRKIITDRSIKQQILPGEFPSQIDDDGSPVASPEERKQKLIRYALWGSLGITALVIGVLVIKKFNK